MNLLSLSLSANGLAKLVEAVELAKTENRSFYEKFNRIKVLYIEDLPKNKKYKPDEGNLDYIISSGRCFVLEENEYCSVKDVRENREHLLRKLLENGTINQRRYERLLENPERAVKVLMYIPIIRFDKRIWGGLIERIKDDLPFEFVYVDMKTYLEDLIGILRDIDENIKISVYSLMPDGNISRKEINNERQVRNIVNQAVIVTTNALGYFGLAFLFPEEYIGIPSFEIRNHYYAKIIEEIKRRYKTVQEPPYDRNKVKGKLLKELEALGYVK